MNATKPVERRQGGERRDDPHAAGAAECHVRAEGDRGDVRRARRAHRDAAHGALPVHRSGVLPVRPRPAPRGAPRAQPLRQQPHVQLRRQVAPLAPLHEGRP